ncbi:MAG: SPOCS domain-containing protein [Tissierellaceae bacterium]
MTIELIKDLLKIEELRGRGDTQTLVETEVYLNPSKPSIEKLLWTDGQVEILSTKAIRDRLVISGVVKFKVVYKSEEEEDNIYSIDSNGDFREEIEIPGITEDMSALVKAHIEYIEDEILDHRKLSLKALVDLEGKVEELNTLEVIKGVEHKDSLQILRETVNYKEILGRDSSYAIVKEAFELAEDKPSIEEVLKISFQAYENESTVVDDRIIISGTVNGRIIYYGEGQIATVEREMPFSHFLELQGAVEGAQAELDLELVEGGFEVLENEEGEFKVLDLEIKLRVQGTAFSENEKSLIVDAYSTKEKIKLEMEEVNLLENIKTLIHRESLALDLAEYRIKELYDLSGYTTIIDTRIIDEGITVDGILSVDAIYLEEDTEEINTLKEEIPYKFYLPVEGISFNSVVEIDIDLESIKTCLYKESTKIEGNIKHRINVNRNRLLKLIRAMEETGELIDKKDRPSITIYIVQNGDILWDIAKRYKTTMEEILEDNESINPNNIIPGEKIIIEKKVDINF